MTTSFIPNESRLSPNYPERIVTDLPGPKAQALLARDARVVSPSYPRDYPFVMDYGRGAEVWDVDGNRFLDFAAGIAVNSTGHAHPHVVQAIKQAADKFLHISSDYYHELQVKLGEKLNDIAPLAERQVSPYMAMTRNVVDPDPHFRTLSRPEAGVPAAAARYSFRFAKPQPVAQVRWNSPYPRWALLADTSGSGAYDRLLALDLAGHVFNTGGTWVARTTMAVHMQPPVKAWGVRLVDLGKNTQMYDFQILAPKPWWPFQPPHPDEVMGGKRLAHGVAPAEAAEVLDVAAAPAAQQVPRGFHIEPWMFNLDGWIDMADAKRPPLREYPAFTNFIASLREHHANTVNMWPPRKFNAVRGKGTYESDLLWPSAYERHGWTNNILDPVAVAFRAEGIRLLTMTRVAYPKPLAEFPAEACATNPAPYVSRHSREYLKGIVREQVRSGVAGVGIGFDEQQWRALGNPRGADDMTRAAFKERYGLDVPQQPEDTLAFRKWIVFAYEEFANYLGEAARVAKTLNPQALTKSPVHLTLGTLWNDAWAGIAKTSWRAAPRSITPRQFYL